MANSSFLEVEDFPEEIRGRASTPGARGRDSLEQTEKEQILKVLAETGFNRSRAAERLGIDRVTLYRKLQKYGISADRAK
jgi:transcriptional regulator of acetoin/glycerol metabolism